MDKVYYLDLQTLLEYLRGQSALLSTEVNVPGRREPGTGYLFLKNAAVLGCLIQLADNTIWREGEQAYQLFKDNGEWRVRMDPNIDQTYWLIKQQGSGLQQPSSAPSMPAADATLCILLSLACNKLGFNIAAALLLILNVNIDAVGNLLTNPLDPVFVPALCTLVVTVVLAGSLMPPVYSLLVGLLNCFIIVFISFYQQHTSAYDQWLSVGYGSLLIAVPIALQIAAYPRRWTRHCQRRRV